MDGVASEVDAIVSAKGARVRVDGLGCTEHLASGFDRVITLPNHGKHWSASCELDESIEE